MRKNKLRWQRAILTAASLLTFLLGIATVGDLGKYPAVAQADAAQHLVEMGQGLYNSGQYQQSLSTWQQASEAFESQGYRPNQVIAH